MSDRILRHSFAWLRHLEDCPICLAASRKVLSRTEQHALICERGRPLHKAAADEKDQVDREIRLLEQRFAGG